MVQQCRRCGEVHDAYAGCMAAAPAPVHVLTPGDEELIGNVVADRYLVGDSIGSGITGTVFAAQHVTFARAAAMKVLRSRYGHPDLVSRVFHGEARAAWSVTHPCLCEVFDIGTLPDGAPFFITEWLDGETLATRIARERLSLSSAVDIMMQLLSAIAAIHARDLLVRDLRPQNIFLAQRRGCRPILKILDFGLARLTPLDQVQAEWATFDTPGAAVNCSPPSVIPFYLSPERTRSEHGVEPASDLFVAAAIFYEALAGERPFSSTSFDDILLQVRAGAHVPLFERRPEISPDVSAFISRALSPNLRDRPSSAKEMQDDLRGIFEGGRKGSLSMAAVSATGSLSGSISITTSSSVATIPDPSARDPIAAAALSLPMSPSSLTVPVISPPPRPAGPRPSRGNPRHADMYLDETETRSSNSIATPFARLPKLNPESVLGPEELSTASKPIDRSLLDEASASNADRTVPPPPLLGHENNGFDEETETTELTPELRARVDELLAANNATPLSPATAPAFMPQRGTKPRR